MFSDYKSLYSETSGLQIRWNWVVIVLVGVARVAGGLESHYIKEKIFELVVFIVKYLHKTPRFIIMIPVLLTLNMA